MIGHWNTLYGNRVLSFRTEVLLNLKEYFVNNEQGRGYMDSHLFIIVTSAFYSKFSTFFLALFSFVENIRGLLEKYLPFFYANIVKSHHNEFQAFFKIASKKLRNIPYQFLYLYVYIDIYTVDYINNRTLSIFYDLSNAFTNI